MASAIVQWFNDTPNQNQREGEKLQRRKDKVVESKTHLLHESNAQS